MAEVILTSRPDLTEEDCNPFIVRCITGNGKTFAVTNPLATMDEARSQKRRSEEAQVRAHESSMAHYREFVAIGREELLAKHPDEDFVDMLLTEPVARHDRYVICRIVHEIVED